jgi:hypothetical protein
LPKAAQRLGLGRSGSREQYPLVRVFANHTKVLVLVRFALFEFCNIEQRFSTAKFGHYAPGLGCNLVASCATASRKKGPETGPFCG